MVKDKLSFEELYILETNSLNVKHGQSWDNEEHIPKYLMRHLPSGRFYIFSEKSQCRENKTTGINYFSDETMNKPFSIGSIHELEIINMFTHKVYTVDEFYCD